MTTSWYIYILQCRDQTYYIGITTDPIKRLTAHNQGTGAKYTRGRVPVTMKYLEAMPDESTARKKELELKKLSKEQKRELIEAHVRNTLFLS